MSAASGGLGWWRAAVWLPGALLLLLGCGPRAPLPPAAVPDGAPPTVEQDQWEGDPHLTDPELLGFREREEWATGLREARGLALGPEGRVYLAGDRQVRVLDAQGTLLIEWGLPGEPTCVAADEQGRVYVGLQEQVLVYDAQGRQVAQWQPLGERAWLTSLAVDGEHVWAADAGNRVVLRYDRQGNPLGRLGEPDEARGIPGLVVPSPDLDLAPTGRGTLLVANCGRLQVEEYTPQGDLVAAWGEAGVEMERFSGCCNPVGLAVLPDGRVVTAEKGLPRVKAYHPDGTLHRIVAGPESFARRVESLDLATDEQGRVWVLDPQRRAVRIFEPRGQ